MPTFKFTILPAGFVQIYDALSCLARFDENVSLEANTRELRISSLNTSRTAYVSFIFNSATFFEKYHFSSGSLPLNQDSPKSWTCKVQNRALLSIFRRRQGDGKEKETSIEKCDFELQANTDATECRLIFKLFCRLNVIKTYRLTYESAEVLHATFDKQGSTNTWTVSARTLRDVVDYFGPKTEHVDWSLHEAKVTFTSYTEKIQVGREIVRQPTHTSVQLDDQDFDECKVEPDLHLSIPVKDFRSVIAHAETMKVNIKAAYSRGHRPIQLTYGSGGLMAEVTLMTKGTSTAVTDNSRASTPAKGLSVRPVSQMTATSTRPSILITSQNTISPPRPKPTKQKPISAQDVSAKPKLSTSASIDTSAPPASLNPQSLFFPAAEDDDDQQWDPQNYEDEPEMVTWDASAVPYDPSVQPTRRLQDTDSGAVSFRSILETRGSSVYEIAPTQKLSQVKGMFD